MEVKIGSYRMHGDAQHKSLQLVEETKTDARAVKANDAQIPVYLWDD